MKPSTLLAVAAAFVAGAFAGAAGADALARPGRAAGPSQYTDGTYNFSLVPPAFAKAEKGAAHTVATFFAPTRENFAANLVVIVQHLKTTLDEFVENSKGDLQKLGLKAVVERKQKVSGRDAVYWEYESAQQRRPLKVFSLAVLDGERLFIVNGTSLASDAEVQTQFRASVDSFRLAD
jgi:hypothetical protein